MNYAFLVAFGVLAVGLVPPLAVAVASGPMGSDQNCIHQEYSSTAGVVGSGSVDFCLGPAVVELNPGAVSFGLTANANGPAQVSGGTIAYTFTVSDLVGCTVNAGTQTTVAGSFGSSSGIRYVVTMTAGQCRGAVTLVVQSGVVMVDIFNQPLAFNAALADDTPTLGGSLDLGITQWPSLETMGQSKRGGNGIQIEGSSSVIEIPETGSTTVPLEYVALVPSGTAATAISNTAPTTFTNGGNAVCNVGGFTAGLTTLPDGSTALRYRREITFDADYCAFTSTVSVQDGTNVIAQTTFWHLIKRETERVSGSLDTNTSISIGNQSVSFPSNLTVAATFPGDVDSPGFDFWALFIFWAILLGICLRMGWWFAAGFAIPGLLDAMFPASVPETFAVWFVFVLIGVVLEAAAAKFSWGPYRKKTGMN